jgi:hypothetical protein
MGQERSLNRYSVTIMRHALEEALIYVSAESKDHAEIVADEMVSEGQIHEFAVNEVEYEYFIDEVDPNHEVVPRTSPSGQLFCWVCARPIAWNGSAVDDPSATNDDHTGVWLHRENGNAHGEIDRD